MIFSIITICYNSEESISSTLWSVRSQTFKKYEHIIIDGGSTDNTLGLIKSISPDSKLISEADGGIYDAINKGISLATGNLVVLLHSGDQFHSYNTLESIVKVVDYEKINLFSVEYFKGDRKVRYYDIFNWQLKNFELGMMPPHLGMIIPRKFYTEYGSYLLKYSIASDFELSFRYLYIHRIPFIKHSFSIVKMSIGGVSSSGINSIITITKEIKDILSNANIDYTLKAFFQKTLLRLKEFIRIY